VSTAGRDSRTEERIKLVMAKNALGHKVVRRLSTEDIKRFAAALRDRGVSDSTRSKHLRVLSVCTQSAVVHGYAARNPVRELPQGERPRRIRKEAAYFANDELPVFVEFLEDNAYRVLFLVALKTGMRLGELLALTWADVDLIEAVIRVRRSYSDGTLGSQEPRAA
jgi:integrase